MSTKTKTELQIESWSNAARTLVITGVDSLGQNFSFEHETNADRSLNSTRHTVNPDTAQYVWTLVVIPPAGVRRGECFIRISVLWNNRQVERLSTGYVTDGKSIAYPPGVFEGFTDGAGLLRSITGTNPAAGVEITEACPTNAKWKMKGAAFQVVADGNAANRAVRLLINDGVTDVLSYPATVLVAATQTRIFRFQKGWPNDPTTFGTLADIWAFISDEIEIFQGWSWRTQTESIQVGDDFGAPVFIVEEWIQE